MNRIFQVDICNDLSGNILSIRVTAFLIYNKEHFTYSWFFRESVEDHILVAKSMMTELDIIRKIREDIT